MRSLTLALVAAALLCSTTPVAAHPRGAARDPFVPLVETGSAAAGDAEGPSTQPPPGDATAGRPPAGAGPSDRLPATGDDPRPWLALAYVLTAAGAGTMFLARALRHPR